MITVQTNHGSYRGRTVDSIVRRVYGRRAFYSASNDPNAPQAGQVLVEPTEYFKRRGVNGWHVLATVFVIDGVQKEEK
jgi:hypothetical protein